MNKKLLQVTIVLSLLSSCAPASTSPEPTIPPTSTVTLTPAPTETVTPLPTSTLTFTPTPTLSPDLNKYECAENVTKADCDFVKDAVRVARYFFINHLGGDILKGIKFTVINDPKDISHGHGGSAGAHIVTNQGELYIWINTGLPIWTEYSSPEFEHNNKGLIIHEFTHEWQRQHGCAGGTLNNPASPTAFLIEGYAGYIGNVAAGSLDDYVMSDDLALGLWQSSEWNETKWFYHSNVSGVIVRHFVEDYGLESYVQYCDAVGQGKQPYDAFLSAYGITIFEARERIMEEILGSLKDCTVAACGAGVDVYSGKYKLGHLLDPTKTTPNLIVRFVDENNEPVVLTHVEMHKQTVGTTGEYAQPFVVPGIFSQAMLPGRYGFTFCEPGYPTDHSSLTCKSPQETEWFDVFEDQVTEVTFQLQQPTTNTNLSSPNLIVTFLDKNGNQIPDLGVEICSYGSPVRICDSGGLTDLNGVYRGYLRSGTYLIRAHIIGAEWPTEMYDIVVNETGVTEVSFKFAKPNLVVKFTDANGTGVPEHELTLCKMVNGVGDCYASSHLGAALGRMGITNMEGIFEALVEPGEYYILTCKIACHLNPPDYKIEDIIVTSETEVTTVEFQLYK